MFLFSICLDSVDPVEGEERQLKRDLRLMEARKRSLELCQVIQNSLTGIDEIPADIHEMLLWMY